MIYFMTVRFRQFVKIRNDRFMAQKGLLQHAADQTSLSFWHLFAPFYIDVLPSRDEAFGHNPSISRDEQVAQRLRLLAPRVFSRLPN